MILVVLFAMLTVLLLLVLPVAWWRGAPFVATDPGKIGRMLRLVQLRAEDCVVDLGSGDGRLIIACAQAGAAATGFELNPLLVWWSRWLVRRRGLGERALVRRQNFWRASLTPFTVVLVFGVGGRMMYELERKLAAELAPGSRVVSNGFELPTWPRVGRDGSLYLYVQR